MLLISACIGVTHRSQAQDAWLSSNEKESLAKARMIYKKLRKGEDFQAAAKAYSDDVGTARRGGNLGFAEKGQMVENFEKAALALKPGEISKPVKTEFGYHLIQLIEKEDNRYNSRHILIRIQ